MGWVAAVFRLTQLVERLEQVNLSPDVDDGALVPIEADIISVKLSLSGSFRP